MGISEQDCAEGARGRWVRTLLESAEPAAVTLVCLPHAGGSATYFASLARAFEDQTIKVLGVQYPGRQDRLSEQPCSTIEEIATQAVGALPRQTGLVLFGHSMGALVAFEMARILEAREHPARMLAVSAHEAPSLKKDDPRRITDSEIEAELRLFAEGRPIPIDDPDIRALSMPAIRADYRALARYRAHQHVLQRTPISVHLGSRDPRVRVSNAAGWGAHTDTGLSSHAYIGGHFYTDDHWRQIAMNLVADSGGFGKLEEAER